MLIHDEFTTKTTSPPSSCTVGRILESSNSLIIAVVSSSSDEAPDRNRLLSHLKKKNYRLNPSSKTHLLLVRQHFHQRLVDSLKRSP